jgi:predicted GNAT family acetyltransferase
MATEVTRQGHRYEVTVEGKHAGFAYFTEAPGVLTFTHTEIDDAFEGKGIGSALAKGALDDVRAQGLLVVPQCPFLRSWIERHPDYTDLVAPSSS